MLGLVDPDLKRPFDVREVIGRIADGSRFEEFKPLFGPTIVCGFASIHGYTVGVLGNNGPIFPDTASKGAHFVQLCNQIDIPIIFLQNITGFVVGKDYERDGQIKKGAQFLNSVSNSTVPHLTIILGASYGAGTYAMSGGHQVTLVSDFFIFRYHLYLSHPAVMLSSPNLESQNSFY